MADRTWQKASSGTGLLTTPRPTPLSVFRPTAPLPAPAASALAKLERAFLHPLMEFASPTGSTVTVSAVDDPTAPYRWMCTAGHDGSHAYASLPFCRDDAKAHAAGCKGLPGVVADYRTAEGRANKLIEAGRAVFLSDLEADDLAHNVDLMAGARATLAKAGRLDLIGGGR